jgi:23S rRNA (cytosine1962-C5)-methyltransferase
MQGDYRLLDSGNSLKLEQIGPYRIVRPSPQAIWTPRLAKSVWDQADAVFKRDSSGSGKWSFKGRVKREFELLFSSLALEIRLTNFGHIGLFPEQAANWEWLRNTIRTRMAKTNQSNLHVLNLFGYTGGSSLAASQAGAHVVHLDAAKGIVDWARKNARKSHLDDRPIRWLIDDADKFVKREQRRGTKYQGIILDPPSFGRGPKGEVFKIERDIMPMLEICRTLLAKDALFVLYSCHTPGFTPLSLQNQLADIIGKRPGTLASGEMILPDSSGRPLPSGAYAHWQAEQ